jgi:hypothetical protein
MKIFEWTKDGWQPIKKDYKDIDSALDYANHIVNYDNGGVVRICPGDDPAVWLKELIRMPGEQIRGRDNNLHLMVWKIDSIPSKISTHNKI